jgi:exopolysaccharide biosynthesis protein
MKAFGLTLLGIISIVLTCALLAMVFTGKSDPGKHEQKSTVNLALMDRYDMVMTNVVSDALDGVLSIEKVYWLNDDELIAPEPNQANFGETNDPSTLGWLIEDAQEILDGQELLFSTKMWLPWGEKVMYYLDETIFAITWKQIINEMMYTISEIKIADPSQFRRFLAGGEYGSDKQFTTTEMAATVNAVVASSGDFYKFRQLGTIVYDGVVRRVNSEYVDTCFINDKGQLLFNRAGEITDMETAQKFVDDNNIRFSLAFGPVLVDNSQCVPIPENYTLGEVLDFYPRAAIAKMPGELHYLMVAANQDPDRNVFPVPNMTQFSQYLQSFGAEKAYALDGGQTAVIVTNDKLINRPSYGRQRAISDIIYFATAIPDGE